MKLREFEGYLQQLKGFDSPKIAFEQYITPAHLASRVLFAMDQSFDDLEDKIVGDFGVGAGMLSIGSQMLGAAATVGFDIDEEALNVALQNMDQMEVDVELVQADVTQLQEREGGFTNMWRDTFDTIIMNPPFGTKNNSGIDMKFLEQAAHVCTGAIYSLNKSSTRNYILKKCKEFNLEGEVVAELSYTLPKTYKFHKKKSVDIEVDFIRFVGK
eukprot:m.105331 g.105331  ORF g.105331 m.105331 type:complete len:214 (-) comp9129_c0_seq1:2374-3015(-)